MTIQMETPLAGGTANGANKKAVDLPMHIITDGRQTATLDRLRHLYLARRFGLTDHVATQLAAVAFAGGAA